MRYQGIALWAMIATLGIDACDGSSGSSGANNDDAMRFIDDIAALICELTVQCCGPEGFTPPADCLNNARTQIGAEITKDLARGATYDPRAGAECLAGYRAAGASCPKRFDVPVCKDVFNSPPRPPAVCDAACPISDAGRTVCGTATTVLSDGGQISNPFCKVEITVPAGSACDPFSAQTPPIQRVCDYNESGGCMCDPAGGSGCTKGICAILKPIGAACTSDITSSAVECVDEAVCSNKVCVLRTPVGGACTAYECARGAFCDNGKCATGSIWKKYCNGDYN